MTITLRTQSATGATTKGSTLTHVELDNNFIDILQNKIQAVDVRGDTGTQLVGQSLSNEILQVVGGTGISTAVTSDSSGQAKITITNTSSGASITDDTATNATRYILFDDVTTGNLTSVNVSSSKLTFNPSTGELSSTQFKTNSIVSASTDTAIAITPNGTGDVQLNADTIRVGDQNSNVTITSYGTGDLILNTNEGTNSGAITILDGVDNDITLVPNGTGKVHAETSEFRIGINNTNTKMTTKGTGDLTLDTNSGTNSGYVKIFDGVNGNIEIVPDGTGQVKIDYSLWPVSDGSATQVLSTNGSGVLSWVSQSTFAPASPGEIGATTPDVGNFTDLKVKSASSVVKELQLHDQDNSNYVGFKAPTTVSTNKVYVLPTTDGTNGQMLTTDGTANLSWTTASSGITLTDDTATASPRYILFDDSTSGSQTAFNVSSTKLTFTPSTGALKATVLQAGTITTSGANNITISTNDGISSGTIVINQGTNGNIEIAPNGTGDVYLTADTLRVGDSNANATITTNGTGDLILNTNAGTNSGSITIEDGSNGDITLAPNGTGRVEILGTANQQAGIRLFEELSSAGNTQSALLQAPEFLSADITLTLPNTTSTLGYQNLPAVGTKTGSYTLATTDVGKYVQVGSGGSITIPNSTFAEGDVIVIVNNHTAAITITCTITDAYIGGTDTDKASVSLATRGVCNILFLSGTRCIITGNVS